MIIISDGITGVEVCEGVCVCVFVWLGVRVPVWVTDEVEDPVIVEEGVPVGLPELEAVMVLVEVCVGVCVPLLVFVAVDELDGVIGSQDNK